MTNIQELLSKPVWQMTGEEFIMLQARIRSAGSAAAARNGTQAGNMCTAYPVASCSGVQPCSTANRTKEKGKIDKGDYPDRAQDYRRCGIGS